MKRTKTNINTYIVQFSASLLVGVISVVYAYPVPALAFSNQISPASLNFGYGISLDVVASAYSSTPDQTDASPFITASGTHVRHGVVASNFLPLGTKIRIGDEEFVVEDRMNPRYNDVRIIDIWMPSRAEATAFGTKTISIQVRLPK